MSQVPRVLAQIRAGGALDFRRKLVGAVRLAANGFLLAINSVWAIPAVLLIRLVRPWRHVRVGKLISDRIGHFVADATLFLAAQSLQHPAELTLDLFWFARPTANRQWDRMISRTWITGWWVWYLVRINDLIPGGSAHRIPAMHKGRDMDRNLQKTRARFDFMSAEDVAAEEWLKRRGWTEGEPFVCLIVRDSAYLGSSSLRAHAGGDTRWSYHNYRDSDIDIFGDAARALIERGYWVIRMGQAVRKPFPVSHPHIIDYPFVEDRDDLLDIWLSAHCSFFISTSLGLDHLAIAYGRRLAIVNSLPYSDHQTFIPSVCASKRLRWRDTGKLLTMIEMLENSHARSEQYESSGIVIEDLSPVVITATVLECEELVMGTRKYSDVDTDQQKRFWEAFVAWSGFRNMHGYLHPEAKAGAEWLRSMGTEFLPNQL